MLLTDKNKRLIFMSISELKNIIGTIAKLTPRNMRGKFTLHTHLPWKDE